MTTTNETIRLLLNRASVRHFTNQVPTDEAVHAIVRAGQQAPFAAQLASVLLRRDRETNPFHAPLLFTALVDVHRMEAVMAARGWKRKMSDVATLLLGIQDAAYMAQNMVIAAEALGMGSCFLGAVPYAAEQLMDAYELPPKVLPIVGLAMGYPAERPRPRPRYPLEFTLFEDRYPAFDAQEIGDAMTVMDDGYLAQDYYRQLNAKIPLRDGSDDRFTYEDYSWTEHIARKLGQWGEDPDELLKPLATYGFQIDSRSDEDIAAHGGLS